MIVVNEFEFFKNATTTGYSPELSNMYGDGLVVTVTGNFSGTIQIYGKKNNDTFKLTLVDVQTLAVLNDITAAGAYLVVAPYGFPEIGAAITSLTSGSVTVSGRLSKKD